jgi:hypothetical protein
VSPDRDSAHALDEIRAWISIHASTVIGITVGMRYTRVMSARIAPLVWLCGSVASASLAAADPGFIESPLPAQVTAPAPSPAPPATAASSAELERAAREAHQKLELQELERRRSLHDLEDYRASQQRALEIEHSARRPTSDAERVRADIDHAREQVDLQRAVDRAEERAPTRPHAP